MYEPNPNCPTKQTTVARPLQPDRLQRLLLRLHGVAVLYHQALFPVPPDAGGHRSGPACHRRHCGPSAAPRPAALLPAGQARAQIDLVHATARHRSAHPGADARRHRADPGR